MKKVITVLVLFSSLFVNTTTAQQLNVNWSENQVFSNKVDGFLDGFEACNSNYIYAKYTSIQARIALTKEGRRTRKMKFITYDKKTMKKVNVVTVFDKKDRKTFKKYEGLVYYKMVACENVVYIFWIKEAKNKDELYVQSMDSKLNPINPLKKVYELTSERKDAKKAELLVLSNKRNMDRILIGGEKASGKGEKITLEYKLLNSDFSLSSANQVTLPVVVLGKSNNLSSSYEMGNDGNLHIKSYVRMTKDERKAAKKGESTVYPIYSLVDLATGKIESHEMKFNNKNIFNFDFIAGNEYTKFFGFFCDLTKDAQGIDTHGIFYSIMDPKTHKFGDMVFSYFTKSQLDELFKKDKSDRNKRSAFKSKKANKSNEESLSNDYFIESVQSMDKDNIVLFCSMMHNYTVTTCNKNVCVTNYYCEKENVTAFRLDKTGAITWASNLNRKMTYDGWNVYDVKVMTKEGKFYVAYGSRYAINTDKQNFRSKKSRKMLEDRFEYGVFDYETGKFTRNEYKVNNLSTPKKDKKQISARAIDVFDNQFFVSSTKVHIKTLPVVLGCLGGLICLPVAAIPFMNGNNYEGSGYMGRIDSVK